MLVTSLLLSLGLAALPADHHERTSTLTVRTETVPTVAGIGWERLAKDSNPTTSADSLKKCRSQGALKYRPVPFGSLVVAEYRGMPFGAPTPQNPKNCKVATAGKRGARSGSQ